MALVAVLVVGGSAWAISSLGGDDPATPEPDQAEVADPGTSETPEPEATPDIATLRAQTNVAVLNGTAINGLAAEVSAQLAQLGYQEGQTANYTGPQRAESVAYFRDGREAEANDVAETLEISDVQPMGAEIEGQEIGNAEVVVIAGHDQAP